MCHFKAVTLFVTICYFYYLLLFVTLFSTICYSICSSICSFICYSMLLYLLLFVSPICYYLLPYLLFVTLCYPFCYYICYYLLPYLSACPRFLSSGGTCTLLPSFLGVHPNFWGCNVPSNSSFGGTKKINCIFSTQGRAPWCFL